MSRKSKRLAANLMGTDWPDTAYLEPSLKRKREMAKFILGALTGAVHEAYVVKGAFNPTICINVPHPKRKDTFYQFDIQVN